MTIELTEWDARNILESLCALEEKWLQVIQTSTNEDEQAEYGNDLALLRYTKDRFREQAIAAFGSNITNFSRQLV